MKVIYVNPENNISIECPPHLDGYFDLVWKKLKVKVEEKDNGAKITHMILEDEPIELPSLTFAGSNQGTSTKKEL